MAISRSHINIYIVDADTNASALASTDIITGEIKSYNKSGGTNDLEIEYVFGGSVSVEKPRELVELSFEFVPKLSSDSFTDLAYVEDSGESGVYTMYSSVGNKAVYIEADDGTNQRSWGFNNCQVTVSDFSHDADNNQSGTLNMKFTPTTDSGTSNFMVSQTTVESLPAWSALD